MNDEILIHDENDLKSKIHTGRGLQVMLDFDLAVIYGYDTRSFNKQVNNNIERFDEDFRFQLTKEEFDEIILMCKIYTSSWGGTRKLPYAFTEQGIYMLMTVLRGVTLFSDNVSKGLHETEFNDFCKEYPKISSKDAGARTTAISQISDKSLYQKLIPDLLKNPILILK